MKMCLFFTDEENLWQAVSHCDAQNLSIHLLQAALVFSTGQMNELYIYFFLQDCDLLPIARFYSVDLPNGRKGTNIRDHQKGARVLSRPFRTSFTEPDLFSRPLSSDHHVTIERQGMIRG